MLDDEIANIGAYLIKQVAARTDDGVHDGTTSSTILAQAIVNEADSMLKQGVNPVYVKRGIDKAMEFAVKKLKRLVQESNQHWAKKHVATISANGDKEIGKLIAEIYKKTGKDGVIKVEEGLTTETTVEYTKDMKCRQWLFKLGIH